MHFGLRVQSVTMLHKCACAVKARSGFQMACQFTGVGDSQPAIGGDGTIFYGSTDANLYAVYPNGQFRWSYLTGNGINSSPPSVWTLPSTWVPVTTCCTQSTDPITRGRVAVPAAGCGCACRWRITQSETYYPRAYTTIMCRPPSVAPAQPIWSDFRIRFPECARIRQAVSKSVHAITV